MSVNLLRGTRRNSDCCYPDLFLSSGSPFLFFFPPIDPAEQRKGILHTVIYVRRVDLSTYNSVDFHDSHRLPRYYCIQLSLSFHCCPVHLPTSIIERYP